jgi:SAM-dependent methyltransferase
VPELDLPYFDQILDGVARRPDSALADAFDRHVHWGYFVQPDRADGSVAGYRAAAEAMTVEVCGAAQVGDGLRVLDVGCGFGGTVDHLNHHLDRCELVGVNIDARQLDHARARIRAMGDNSVRFVESDATAMPFDDGSFDVILAVECIFHFPSRKRFLREARRLLADGGRLALTDFVCGADGLAPLLAWQHSHAGSRSTFYGANHKPLTSAGYAKVARGAGLAVTVDRDITPETMPTYPAMRNLYDQAGLVVGVEATDELEEVARRGLLEYHLLALAPA